MQTTETITENTSDYSPEQLRHLHYRLGQQHDGTMVIYAFPVRQDGSINLQYVGRVGLAGKTLADFEHLQILVKEAFKFSPMPDKAFHYNALNTPSYPSGILPNGLTAKANAEEAADLQSAYNAPAREQARKDMGGA